MKWWRKSEEEEEEGGGRRKSYITAMFLFVRMYVHSYTYVFMHVITVISNKLK